MVAPNDEGAIDIDPTAGGVPEGVADPGKEPNGDKAASENPEPAVSAAPVGSAEALAGLTGVEPELMAVDAVDALGLAIAQRVVKAPNTGTGPIVLIDRSTLAALQLHRALSAQVSALAGIDRTATAAFAITTAAATAGTLIRGAGRLAGSIVAADKYLKTEIIRQDHRFTLPPALLQAAVAGHLASQEAGERQVIVPHLSVPVKGEPSLLLSILREAARPAPPDTDASAHAAHKALGALASELFVRSGTGLPTLAEQLLTAEQVALPKDALLLTMDLTVTGGSYRLRQSWWRSLLGLDGLLYAGSAAASFFLLDASDYGLLDSGVLYATTGHTRFRPRTSKAPWLSDRRTLILSKNSQTVKDTQDGPK